MLKKSKDIHISGEQSGSYLKEFVLFPVIAVVMGLATILVILLIFPVWLFKEQNPRIS